MTGYTVQAAAGDFSVIGFDGTSATIFVAENGLTYSFTVTAQNAKGAGPPSTVSNTVLPLSNLPVLVPSASVWALVGMALALAAAAVLASRRRHAMTQATKK